MKFIVLVKSPDVTMHKLYSLYGKAMTINQEPYVKIASDELVLGVPLVQVRLTEPPTRRGLRVWLHHQHIAIVLGGDERKIGFAND